MSYEGGKLTPEEIRQIVADVVDNYYDLLVDYLNRKFREKDLHIDQVYGLVANVKASLEEHRKIEDNIDIIRHDVQGIKKDMDCIEGAIRDLDQHLRDYYRELAENIARQFWEQAPEDFRVIWSKLRIFLYKYFEVDPDGVAEFFAQLKDALSGAFGGISDIIGGIVDWLKKIAEALAKLPTFVDSFVNTIANFFKTAWDALVGATDWLWRNIQEFASDPWGWFRRHLVEPVWSGLQWLAGKIWEGLQWLGQNLVNVGKTIFDALVAAGRGLANILTNVIASVASELKATADTLFGALGGLVQSAVRTFIDPIRRFFQENLVKALRGTVGGAEFFVGLPLAIIPSYLAAVSLPKLFSALADHIKEIRIKLGLFGTGGEVSIQIGKFFEKLAKAMEPIPIKLTEALTIGWGLVAFEPLRYVFRSMWKRFANTLGVDIIFQVPSESKIINFMRRALPEKLLRYLGASETREGLVIKDASGNPIVFFKPFVTWEFAREYVSEILWMFGLPEKFLDYLRLDDADFYLWFKDRFGQTRRLPLSPIFELPTHSELVRMTQKDIFPSIKIAQAVAALRGWSADLTVMEYLLTFKYPSFEKLWKFYLRALSGMLWFTPPKEARDIFANEAINIGAGIPISPYDIQVRLRDKGEKAVRAIETALSSYLKWIEYANFSWFTKDTVINDVPVGKIIYDVLGGWTADSWLMWDIAADIPGKIDARWMAKWGIFDWLAQYMSEDEITGFAPLVDVLARIQSVKPTNNVIMNLELFSKLLLASGLHPAWVPVTAIAEAINALSDERTLLRTGLINFYKEGIMKVESLEALMSNFITAYFNVLVYDTAEKKWKRKTLGIPVAFLPAERKLLEIRALMDRVLDLFREFYKFVIRAVGRNIVSPDDAKSKIAEFVDKLNKLVFIPGMSAITGIQPDEVAKRYRIELDEIYASVWLEYAQELHEAEKYERARMYLRYLVSRIADRFAQGYVTEEEFELAKKIFKDYAKATDLELELINKTAELLSSYYTRRLASEALINQYRRFRITKDELLSKLKELGLPEEVAGYLVEKYARSYAPTITQVASMAEIVPEVLSVEFRGVPFYRAVLEFYDLTDTEKMLWELYIKRKPYKSDVDKIITRFVELLSRGAGEEILGKIVGGEVWEWLKQWGVDDTERMLIRKLALAEAYKDAWSEAHLSVSRLVSMVELLPEVLERLEAYLSKYDIPEDVKQLWLRYARLKAYKGDVSPVIANIANLWSYGAPDSVIKYVLGLGERESLESWLAQWGLDETERNLLRLRAKSDEYERVWREAHLSVSRLAGMVEYLPWIVDRLVELLRSHGLGDDVVEVWKSYALARAYRDDVRRVLSEFERLLAAGVEREVAEKFVEGGVAELAKKYGFDEFELGLLFARARMRRFLDEWNDLRVTPSKLAGWVELLPEGLERLRAKMAELGLPEEWRELWGKYLWRKMVRDDFGYLKTQLRRLIRHGIDISKVDWLKAFNDAKKEYEKVAKFLGMFGVTADEYALWKLEGLAYQLLPEELRIGLLATISEYVDIPDELIDQVLAWYKIPEVWWPYIKKYLKSRPLQDELRRLANALYKAWVRAVELGPYEEKALALLKAYGWTDKELEILQLAAKIERLVAGKKERWPTPSQIATLAEYVPEARKFLEHSFEAHDVPPEIRPIWKRYVQIKPWYDELRRLVTEVINEYARGVIDDAHMRRFLEWLKQFGYEDEELKFLYTVAALRRKYYQMTGRFLGGGTAQPIPAPTPSPAGQAVKPRAGGRKFVW